jgi:hypothetical protein
MQAVICAMASEWMDVINPLIYTYALFADRNPRYGEKILPYVSDWLFFRSADGLEGFATGGKPFAYFWAHLPIWWPKIVAWTVVAGLVCVAMLCVNALMAEQWTNHEKLAFPIVQLPLEMTRDGGASPFWRSKYLWGGFGAMFAIDLLNGFAFLYPALPSLNVRFLGDLSLWFPSPPWNQIGWTPIGIFPFVSAIGFFMPTDLLFSAVFFFFVRKAQQVIAYSLGYEQGVFGGGGLVPSPPYFSEQSWGAFLGLFVTAAWVARGYLRNVWRAVWDGGDTSPNQVPPRLAFGGLVLSLVALGVVGVAIGLSAPFVIGYVVLFLAFSIAMTRLRAQLGPPTHEMAFMGPNQLIVDFRGSQGFTPDAVARTVTAFHFMNRIHRTHPMPHQLEAMYLAERSRLSQRWVFVALLIATLAGSVLGHLVRIYLGYRWTPGDAGGETANVVSTLTGVPRAPNPGAIAAVFTGLGVVLLLDAVRFPRARPAAAPGRLRARDELRRGLLLVRAADRAGGQVLRAALLRPAGYGKLRMVAFGLILGEFAAEAIWATFSMFNDRQLTYTISINGKMGWQQ